VFTITIATYQASSIFSMNSPVRYSLFKVATLIALLLMSAFFNSTMAQNATLPKPQISLPSMGSDADAQLSSGQEKVLGKLIWRDLRSDPTVLTDPLINGYLRALTQHLQGLSNNGSNNLGVDVSPFAVQDSTLNAFAMPSGLLGIHTGLMLNVAHEGELAAVLAHEIGHVSQRHFVRGMAQKKNTGWIGAAGFIAALLAAHGNPNQTGQLLEAAVVGSQAVQASRQLSFSRDMEREADAIGLTMLQDSGNSGYDMVRMLRRLGAASQLNEGHTAYAKSHPAIAERMANIQGRLRPNEAFSQSENNTNNNINNKSNKNTNNINTASNTPSAAQPLSFYLMQARLMALLASHDSTLDETRNTLSGRIDSSGSAAPVQQASHYGLALLALSQNDVKQAEQQLAYLLTDSHTAAHPWVQALAFEVAVAKHPTNINTNSPESLALSALLAPLPASAAQLQAVLVALNSNTSNVFDTQLIASWLGDWLAKYPNDDVAWGALAQLYTQQAGAANSAFAAWAQAEQSAAMGIHQSGINGMNTALRLGENTVPATTMLEWRKRLVALKDWQDDEKALLKTLR
jgi:predicted Zn-dependent protease